MAGILDSKNRVIDLILTKEGRKQLANGSLRMNFYSFSDSCTLYDQSTIVTSSEYSQQDRFVLEAGNLPQDLITFESDDSGNLIGFPISSSNGLIINNGHIYRFKNSGSHEFVTGSDFSSISGDLLFSGSIDSFRKQYILKSPDILDVNKRIFQISPITSVNSPIVFSITDTEPFDNSEIYEAKVEHTENFFQDKKLSHLPNFMFLPPVNSQRPGENEKVLLGEYVNISQKPIKNYEELYEKDLRYFKEHGFSKEVIFTETSNDNNLVSQFFEVKDNQITKLDIIDFGEFSDPKQGNKKHVFFVGKIFIDGYSNKSFINLFTLVFE